MIAVFCAWLCWLAVYLVLAGQVSGVEVVAGVLCSAAAVLWWIGTTRASGHRFVFAEGTWTAAGRAWRGVPGATLSVAFALMQALLSGKGGAVRRSFYAHGIQTDPSDAGRRAVGVLAASLAPDSFVLRTPTERDEIVVHSLPRDARAKDPRWPI